MIAMQYSFTLPADYDMEIIDRRIREKGALLNGFPDLCFKAYLTARKQGARAGSAENLYAPFYVWDRPAGLNAFLAGRAFAALARDFGWPVIRTWMVWHAAIGADDLRSAVHATRRIMPIEPHTDIDRLRKQVLVDRRDDEGGAMATIVAFDPQSWTLIRFCMFRQAPAFQLSEVQSYRIGYVALP